jgi:hypothetical protein
MHGENNPKPALRPWFGNIPAELREQLAARLVVDIGAATGPGFVAGRFEKLAVPLPLEEGIDRVEALGRPMDCRRAHALLDDGTTLWFVGTDGAFERYDGTPQARAPRPGLSVSHPRGGEIAEA